MKTLRLLTVLAMIMSGTAKGQQSVMNVCELIKTAKRYDHKTVVVTGFVHADIHWTGIKGEGCSGGVVIRYDFDSAPRDFVNGVEARRGRLDTRPFKVTVEGKFHARVPAPRGYIRRIEVTKVLDWEFVDGKATVKPTPMTH